MCVYIYIYNVYTYNVYIYVYTPSSRSRRLYYFTSTKVQILTPEELPDFWALLFVAVIFILNALVWFIQRWSLKVKVRVQYQSCAALTPGKPGVLEIWRTSKASKTVY